MNFGGFAQNSYVKFFFFFTGVLCGLPPSLPPQEDNKFVVPVVFLVNTSMKKLEQALLPPTVRKEVFGCKLYSKKKVFAGKIYGLYCKCILLI